MNRTFRRIALFLFPLFASFLPGRTESANATVYHNLRNYTVDDGLSSNHVYGIVQDSAGFIWFGTDNGLCRFDGHEFRSYTHADGDRSSISSNNIRRMTLDSRGQIWLALDNARDRPVPAFRRQNRRRSVGYRADDRSHRGPGGGDLDRDRQFGAFPLESRNEPAHSLPPSSR